MITVPKEHFNIIKKKMKEGNTRQNHRSVIAFIDMVVEKVSSSLVGVRGLRTSI